jgi:putative hydroxymethylpyrimidine transport system permease protein
MGWIQQGARVFMLHANARMQIDIMFAALSLLCIVSLTLYFLVDWTMIKIVYWQKDGNKKEESHL